MSRRQKQQKRVRQVEQKPIEVETSNIRKFPWIIVLPSIAFALYISTLGHQYVLDDNLVITPNQHIEKGFSGIGDLFKTNFGNGFQNFNDGLYRPLSLVTFAIEKQFFGLNPGVSHFFNVLIYAALILTLLLWLSEMFEKNSMFPYFIVLLFAVHPLHTEVVANVKSRDELLAFLFFTLGALYFTKWLESSKFRAIIISVVFFFAALLSKESAVAFLGVFPLIIIISMGWRWRKITIGTLLMGIPVLVFLLIRYKVLNAMGPVDTGVSSLLQNSLIENDGLSNRIGTGATIQGSYIQKLFIPINLSHDYSYNAIPVVNMFSGSALLWLIFNITLLGSGIWAIIKRKWWGFGILFYYITIAIVANVFILIGAMAAERFVFAPSLGWAIAISAIIAGLKLEQQHKIYIISVIATIFTVLTVIRIPDWKTNFALFTADVVKVPESARAHYNAGTVMSDEAIKQKPINKALLIEGREHLMRATQIWPEYQDAYNNLGTSYMNSNELEQAADVFAPFIERFPDYQKARYNMGMICYRLKRYAECETNLERYFDSNPNDVEVLYLIIDAEGFQGKFEEAIQHCNELIAKEPRKSRGYQKLGMAYAIIGNLIEAEKILRKAVEIEPSNPENHFSLGSVYQGARKMNEAVAEYRKTIELKPGHSQAISALQQLGLI